MKLSRKVAGGVLALGLAVGGCSAASHLHALQPTALAASTSAAASAGAASAPLFPARRVTVRKPAIQLGAGVDLYTYPHQDFAQASAGEITFLKSLHANAVMVSFPFFQNGRRGSRIYAKKSTPTPAQLAVFAQAAARAGLWVVLRPLEAETSLGEPRNLWKPAHPNAWFASYTRFLLPYARMAQRIGVPKLYVGTEFTRFGRSPWWNGLDRAVRKVYKGTLGYANNGHRLGRGLGGNLARLSADAYPEMPTMPASASVRRLTRAWVSWDQVMPRGTVLSEVGIAAVRGAYHKPWVHAWPRPRMDTAVQSRWFTAACRAMKTAHLGGIYFWAIGFGNAELQTRPNPDNQAAWDIGPGHDAVAACFRQLRG